MKKFPKNRPLRLSPASIHELMMRDDFSPEIIGGLSEYQKLKIRRFIRARLPHCKPKEQAMLSARLAMLAPDADMKQDTWEYHHANVCTAIAGYLHEEGMMPTLAFLVAKTGYSRQTITRHLKAYREQPRYIEQVETMRVMAAKVTEKMLSMALHGDIRAAKVFMETVSRAERRNAVSQSEGMPLVQNNFFRINGIFITEEKLSRLLPEQRAQLDALLNMEELVESDPSLSAQAGLGGEDKNDTFTLYTVDQIDSVIENAKDTHFGTNVNPNVTLNPLSESR